MYVDNDTEDEFVLWQMRDTCGPGNGPGFYFVDSGDCFWPTVASPLDYAMVR